MKIRLGYDLCTPTMERRETTFEDIKNDTHIRDFSNKAELMECLDELCDNILSDDNDVTDWNDVSEKDLDKYVVQALRILDDVSDGSPNILFLIIDGNVYQNLLDLSGQELNNITEEELAKENSLEPDDDKWEDDYPDYVDEDFDDENMDESLTEDTHAKYAKPEGDRIGAFNNALKYAKKENKPFIYGYTNSTGKFFALDQPIKCTDINAQTKEFKNKYKNCNVVYTAYPDKDFINESLEEDVEDFSDSEFDSQLAELQYYATHPEPLNMELLDSVLESMNESVESKDIPEPEWERKKQRTLEYYNTVKEWAGDDALNRTSCRFNIAVDRLKEWIEGENKND